MRVRRYRKGSTDSQQCTAKFDRLSESQRQAGKSKGPGRGDVLKMILKEGAVVILIGVFGGLVGAVALTRVMESLLYEVSATDPLTFSGLSIILFAVAILACYIPARRATRVDPMIALRHE
jgi:putative ABC transport system permease protein